MPSVSVGALLVFLIILVALILFVTEPVPIDVTALGVMVTLMVLRPWTGISPSEGVSGFSNAATITILAMMILSEGVRRTGVIQRIQATVAAYTGKNVHKQLGATVGLVGPLSGLINNTAAVAILLPMVSDLAHENRTSPSKLLLPLSYASMAGGMLTLIGTSTNLLARPHRFRGLCPLPAYRGVLARAVSRHPPQRTGIDAARRFSHGGHRRGRFALRGAGAGGSARPGRL
mgnify:CR=1 FL=1